MTNNGKKKCLNCGYERQPEDESAFIPESECPKCRAIYEKVEKWHSEKKRKTRFLEEEQQSRAEKDLAPKSSLEDSQKSTLSKPFYKNTHIIALPFIAVLIFMICFAVYKSSVRDTSSPSKAYVGHWKYKVENRGKLFERDDYIKSDGTMIIIVNDGTKLFGIWKVTSENAAKRELSILWKNAGDQELKRDISITFSRDFKSFSQDTSTANYYFKDETYSYIDGKTSP